MDSPPRNDEWMPLASQQLRLRHLVRIIGLNIACRHRCKLYFTLHHKPNCPAFYRSAEIQHYGNSEAILWDNIVCPGIFKSNSRAVCVRIWERSYAQPEKNDVQIFTWRVWFSGLILTGSGIDAKHFSNTLIFQLNENCFSSPEHFSSFSLYNTDYDNANDHDPNAVKIHNTELKELTCDPETREIGQSDSTTKSKYTDSSLDLCGIRCIAARRLKNSTRESYNLEKLLRIQQIQRNCMRLKQDLHNITEQIINHDHKRKSFVAKNRSSIDYLLSDMDEVKPEAKIECKKLKIKIEQLRFKCNLLEKEHKLAIERNKELIRLLRNKKDLTKNQSDVLRENNSRLALDQSQLDMKMKVIFSGIKSKKDLELMIRKRLGLLGLELEHIYPIKTNSFGFFTVCSLPFPDKNYLSSSSVNTDHSKLMTPATLFVTLGFVEHFVEITAIILDKPLRFPPQAKSSKQILYGIYLLNLNIAQLNYDVFQFPYDSQKEIIQNFRKFFRSLINLSECKDSDNAHDIDVVDKSSIEGELSILHAINRIENVQKAKTSLQPNNSLQMERSMSPRRRRTTTGPNEDKRYYSDDNLNTLAEHCLKHSYSHERLDKE